MNWYLQAAKLHLYAFYLLEESAMEGYNDNILSLYQAAKSLIDLSQDLNSNQFLLGHCPFFCYQIYVCASFVILKIWTNHFFRQMIDEDAGRALIDTTIIALRTISVVNNDLPARLGDVLAFLCTLDDPSVVGGKSAADLRLREVRNRLSMSVVYDSLWIWRKHFKSRDAGDERTTSSQDKYSLHAVAVKLANFFTLGFGPRSLVRLG